MQVVLEKTIWMIPYVYGYLRTSQQVLHSWSEQPEAVCMQRVFSIDILIEAIVQLILHHYHVVKINVHYNKIFIIY